MPLMVSTGLLEMHGAAYMADCLLPAAVVTSPTLDLSTKHGAAAAHLYRIKAKEQVELSKSLVRAAVKGPHFASFKTALYPSDPDAPALPEFFPPFSSSAIWSKWGAVTASAPGGLGVRLMHLHLAYQALYSSNASRFVCFPFCYVAGIKSIPTGANGTLDALLFPNRKTAGYQCALPTDMFVARLYVAQLREALAAIHGAGLIHGDLYISNIIWRLSADGRVVELKVID